MDGIGFKWQVFRLFLLFLLRRKTSGRLVDDDQCYPRIQILEFQLARWDLVQ